MYYVQNYQFLNTILKNIEDLYITNQNWLLIKFFLPYLKYLLLYMYYHKHKQNLLDQVILLYHNIILTKSHCYYDHLSKQ